MSVITGGSGNDNIQGGDEFDLIRGKQGDDEINGGDGSDTIRAGMGEDTIDGGTGADSIQGGEDDDVISGGEGSDIVKGGTGSDSIDGGDGEDRLQGKIGADTIDGGDGDDTVSGGRGTDVLSGGDGADIVGGGKGQDILDGGKGADTLKGGDGEDLIEGGDGNDSLRGEVGADTLSGGAGADLLAGGRGADVINGGDGADTLSGGRGNDTLNVSGEIKGEIENKGGGKTTVKVGGKLSTDGDTLKGEANAEAEVSSGDTVLKVEAKKTFGKSGFDITSNLSHDFSDNTSFFAGGTFNTSSGSFNIGFGFNFTFGGRSTRSPVNFNKNTSDLIRDYIDALDPLNNDVIDFGFFKIDQGETVQITTFLENDIFSFEYNPSLINVPINGSTSLIDSILPFGSFGNDVVDGGEGNDVIAGGQGDDILIGGLGEDTILGGEGKDEIHGGKGNDILSGDHGFDTLAGGEGSDTFRVRDLRGNEFDRITDFTPGEDKIELALGDDTLVALFSGNPNDAPDGTNLIYDPNTGLFYYNPDGVANTGDEANILELQKNLDLDADDFTII